MDKKTIGAHIKEARIEKGLKLGELADLLYINPRSVSRYENGEIDSIECIEQIARITDCPIAYLLDITPTKNPNYASAQDTTGLSEHALGILAQNRDLTAEDLSTFIDNGFLELLMKIYQLASICKVQKERMKAYKKAQSVIDFKLTGETLVNKLADIDDSVLENLITDNLNYCFDVISASEIDKVFSAPEDAQTDPALYIETRGCYISDKIYLLRNGIPVYPGICLMVLPKDISPGRFKLIRAVYSALVYTKDLLAKYEERISAQRYMISKTFDNLIDKYIEHTIKNG